MSNENATQEVETEEEVETSEDSETESKLVVARKETIADLINQRHAVKDAEDVVEDTKLEHKEAKLHQEATQEKLNRLVDQLEDIENGNYQPLLVFPADEPAEDPGKTFFVGDLDITPGQVEKLNEAEIGTVAQLEEAIRQGKIQSISGIGETAVDRISDAVVKYREEFPVPEPGVTNADESTSTVEGMLDDAEEKLSSESEV